MAIQWTEQERFLARKWYHAQRAAEKFLAHERQIDLQKQTAQQSFQDFLDLWDFYWGIPNVAAAQQEDSAHRLRLAGVFQKLRKHA